MHTKKVLLSMLWITVTTLIVLALSAGTASAQSVEICHNGKTITVNIHAALAHLNHGDSPGACGGTTCACGLEFDPVTCADGKKVYDAADTAGAPVIKRLAPVVGGLGLLLLVIFLIRRLRS